MVGFLGVSFMPRMHGVEYALEYAPLQPPENPFQFTSPSVTSEGFPLTPTLSPEYGGEGARK